MVSSTNGSQRFSFQGLFQGTKSSNTHWIGNDPRDISFCLLANARPALMTPFSKLDE